MLDILIGAFLVWEFIYIKEILNFSKFLLATEDWGLVVDLLVMWSKCKHAQVLKMAHIFFFNLLFLYRRTPTLFLYVSILIFISKTNFLKRSVFVLWIDVCVLESISGPSVFIHLMF